MKELHAVTLCALHVLVIPCVYALSRCILQLAMGVQLYIFAKLEYTHGMYNCLIVSSTN